MIELLNEALSNPNKCFTEYIDGHKIVFFYDNVRKWFEAHFSYNPKWGHIRYIYATSPTELIEKIGKEIKQYSKL